MFQTWFIKVSWLFCLFCEPLQLINKAAIVILLLGNSPVCIEKCPRLSNDLLICIAWFFADSLFAWPLQSIPPFQLLWLTHTRFRKISLFGLIVSYFTCKEDLYWRMIEKIFSSFFGCDIFQYIYKKCLAPRRNILNISSLTYWKVVNNWSKSAA